MKYEFGSMTERYLKQVYQELWEGHDFPCEIVNTWWRQGNNSRDSQNSFQFSIENVDRKNIIMKDASNICAGLKKIFQISNDSFEGLFYQACIGQGKEFKRILTLHSSALCSLLFFSDLEKNPMKLNLNGINVTFNKAIFEYKNRVLDNGLPSNIDIVLISEDEKTLLFLESKFFEYVNKTSCSPIRSSYLKTSFYKDDFLKEIGLRIEKENDEPKKYFIDKNKTIEGFKLETIDSNEKCYLDGIKQMISHYIGLKNFISKPPIDNRLEYIDQNIFLGEIMFDFLFEDAQIMLENYKKVYMKLAEKLNSETEKIKVLSTPLTYSMFKSNDYKLNPQIKEFYFGKMSST